MRRIIKAAIFAWIGKKLYNYLQRDKEPSRQATQKRLARKRAA